jgi:RNA polymerase sigma factor (sigma-70 family)
MRVAVLARFKNSNFRQARIAAGFETQLSLAAYTGISPQTLGEYENFRRYPRNDLHVFKLERALKLPIDDLFPKEYRDAVDRKLGRPVEKTFDVLALPNRRQLLLSGPIESYEIEAKDSNEIKELEESMLEALATLTKREAVVLKMRFGLDGSKPMTFQKVAKLLKVSRERIRQIEAKALRKLKHPSRSRALRRFRNKK